LTKMEDLDLSCFFKTEAQAVDFSTRLCAISDKIYNTNFNLEKTLTDQLGIQEKDKFMTILRNNKIPLSSNSALKDFIGKIQEKISSLPTVSLTLAFEPKEKTLKSLSDWFPLNINQQVLLDIKVDPEIIAGASISYKGKFLDFSVKPVFDQVCNE
jgi:F0F1-type ATP synthase delta subunit